MNARLLLRGISFSYFVLVGFLVWYVIYPPVRRVLYSSPAARLVDIFYVLPVVFVVFLLLAAIRGLTKYTWNYSIIVIVQGFLILFSLVSIIFAPRFGVISLGISAYVFLLLLHPNVEETVRSGYQNVRLQPVRHGRVWDRLIILGMSFTILFFVGWCGVSIYTSQTMSGYSAIVRLAGLPDGNVNSSELRSALLEQTPIGTEKFAVISFLETNNVPRDQFVGGQFVRFQEKDRSVLALFSTPPWVIQLFCTQYHGGVRYVFDETYHLEDIVLENYWACL